MIIFGVQHFIGIIMKNIGLYILLFILFMACSHKQSIQPLLSQAETMIDKKSTDSAYFLLNNVSSFENISEKEYATWCLLHSYARDKCLKMHTSDSIINCAVEYFETTNNIHYKVFAWYTHAKVSMSLGNPIQTQKSFLKAAEYAIQIPDSVFLGRIYYQLGMFYKNHQINEETLFYLNKAYECFCKTGNEKRKMYAVMNIGRHYHHRGQLDSALIAYKKAYPYAMQKHQATILIEMSNIYQQMHNFDNARILLNQACSWKNTNRTALYLSMANYYQSISKMDSAIYYFNKVEKIPNLSLETKATLYDGLYKSYCLMKDWKTAIQYENEKQCCVDLIATSDAIGSFHNWDAADYYDFMEDSISKNEMTLNYHKYGLYAASSLLTLLIAGCIILWRRKDATFFAYLMPIGKQSELSKQNNSFDSDHLTFPNAIYESDICQTFLKKGKEKYLSKEWNELELFLDEECNLFITRLKQQNVALSDIEIKACMLTKIGVNANRISRILKYNSSVLRSRIYKKLTGCSGKAVDLAKYISTY